jgi:hypothetical protein
LISPEIKGRFKVSLFKRSLNETSKGLLNTSELSDTSFFHGMTAQEMSIDFCIWGFGDCSFFGNHENDKVCGARNGP